MTAQGTTSEATRTARRRLAPRLRALLGVLGGLGVISVAVNLSLALSLRRPVGPSPARSVVPSTSPSLTPSAVDAPMAPGERLTAARELFLARCYGEADAHLAILLAAEPRRAELHYWRSLVRKQSGQLDAALASIERARALEPENPAFREQQGEIYLAQGRSEEAADAFDAALKRRPGSFAALMGKSRAMEQMYEAKLPVTIPEIVNPVEEAVRLQPHNPEGVRTLARMCFGYLQQFSRAEQLARQAAALGPDDATPHMILAEVYLNSREPESDEKAVAAAREAVRRDDRRPEPLYLLGRALLRRNDLSGAIEALERSTRIQLMPQAVYQLSLAHARAGNAERAAHYSRLYDSWNRFSERRKALLALYRHRPDDVRIHAQLAELYLAHGARDPARNWARRGLRLRPDDPRLRRVLARLE
jgi:predicted Zn-dependent protease